MLDNLRELILRKSVSNELNEYVALLGDADFVGMVSESLRKMASFKNNDSNNHTMNWFAKHALPAHAEMYRDALGHHTSHYKAALKGGDKKLADTHMSQVMKLLNFGARLGAHSYTDHSGKHQDGADKIKLDAVPDQPWQHWSQQQPKGKFGVILKNPNEKSNYDHLRGSPHGHKEYAVEINNHRKRGNDFTGAWPVEHTKVNDKYIDIDHDMESPGKYKGHMFDKHPVLEYYKHPQHKLTDEHHSKFVDEATKWHHHENPDVNKWFDEKEAKPMSAGDKPSAPVHNELKEYTDSEEGPHDPQKHKLRLDHALSNPNLYHKPTINKAKRQKDAMDRVAAATGADASNAAPAEAPKEKVATASETPSASKPETKVKRVSAADRKAIASLKNIHMMPEHVQSVILSSQPDHVVEAAGLTELRDKFKNG